MKSFRSPGVLLLTVVAPLAAQENWKWQNPTPQGHPLYSIQLMGDKIVFCGGRQNTLLMTADDGDTWSLLRPKTDPKNANDDLPIHGMVFPSAQVGYGYSFWNGPGGLILKTTDGGTSWSWINGPAGAVDGFIGPLVFRDENVGYAYSPTAIYQTKDGGGTWTLSSPVPDGAYVLAFKDADNWFLSNYRSIFRTRNAGLGWDTLRIPDSTSLTALKFVSDSTWLGLTNVFRNRDDFRSVFLTRDAGGSWTRITVPIKEQLLDAVFPTSQIGFAVGENGTALKTVNAGVSWDTLSVPYDRYYFCVRFRNADEGYIVGSFGNILRTRDGGAHWTSLVKGILPSTPSLGMPHSILSSYFPDGDTGYAAASDGSILKTVDAGDSWDVIARFPHKFLTGIYFSDAKTGVLMSSGADSLTVLRTRNGGVTWDSGSIIPPVGSIFNVSRLNFINANLGFATVGTSFIWSTADGGTTWTHSPKQGEPLRDIHFPTRDTGYAVGDLGFCARSLDGGKSWDTLPRPHRRFQLAAVHFTSGSVGYVGGDGGFMAKTQDAGQTWTTMDIGTTGRIERICFASPQVGYTVGSDAMTLTRDGGNTWSAIYPGIYPGNCFISPAKVVYLTGSENSILSAPLPDGIGSGIVPFRAAREHSQPSIEAIFAPGTWVSPGFGRLNALGRKLPVPATESHPAIPAGKSKSDNRVPMPAGGK